MITNMGGARHPYQEHVETFNEAMKQLLPIAPVPKAVDAIQDETVLLAFVNAFRKLIRIMSVLKGFAKFSWADLFMAPQDTRGFQKQVSGCLRADQEYGWRGRRFDYQRGRF
ncbi:MAG: hypothetical protein ACFB0Z_15010 [Candidatus Phaeomarinobacter sp.]